MAFILWVLGNSTTPLSLIYVNNYTTIALFRLNAKQTAVEIDYKGQHVLITNIL
ncbi:hypothetical protein PSPO_b0945 [Pseudoalteromonas spongiae UST010723-006]|nr:hypothetical protein PSPO_b0945 [Pseudoalteromonas spongiae UST010723-006]